MDMSVYKSSNFILFYLSNACAWLLDNLTPSLPVPTDDVVSRVFIESSALQQVVAIHSGMAADSAGLVSSHIKPMEVFINDDEEGERLCGFQDLGINGKTYFSEKELRLLYHTSEGGMGFSNGFKLIFTVTKLDENASSCSSPDQFKCDNGRCIWSGVTCDGINNCGDSSDEMSTTHPHCRTYQQIYKNFLFRLGKCECRISVTRH
ncbi:UNVERIFIED_CONTAM: Low-density lipoprotein receptor-related protein 3 [Trichonephila clavipes]